MPVYTYKGVSEAGRAIRGFVDAESDRSARAKLRREGVFLTELAVSTAARVRRDDTSPRRFSLDMLRPVGGTPAGLVENGRFSRPLPEAEAQKLAQETEIAGRLGAHPGHRGVLDPVAVSSGA